MNQHCSSKRWRRVKLKPMTRRLLMRFLILGSACVAVVFGLLLGCTKEGAVQTPYSDNLVFPYQTEHVHGSTIVELPNGDLLTAWFQGSGERWADDVRIMGSRLIKGDTTWSVPFVLADIDGFPDINPILFMDHSKRLWLMWYPVLAN